MYRENHEVYGLRTVRRQLRREGYAVARCTVKRLMRAAGLQGVARGRRARTTRPSEPVSERSLDLVQRLFRAERPYQLWVADLTYMATRRGFVCVAFVIDVFSRRIVLGTWRCTPWLSQAGRPLRDDAPRRCHHVGHRRSDLQISQASSPSAAPARFGRRPPRQKARVRAFRLQTLRRRGSAGFTQRGG